MCGKIYFKIPRSLWQYYRDEPFIDDNDAISNFLAANNNRGSFTFKK